MGRDGTCAWCGRRVDLDEDEWIRGRTGDVLGSLDCADRYWMAEAALDPVGWRQAQLVADECFPRFEDEDDADEVC
jgi:hypothetical protein